MQNDVFEFRSSELSSHDKSIFDFAVHSNCIAEFFQLLMGEENGKMVDWSTVRQINSRISEPGGAVSYLVDLMISVHLTAAYGGEEVRMLLEHKSYIDSKVRRQLLKYISVHFQTSDVPIWVGVIYNGKEPWQGPSNFKESLKWGDKGNMERIERDLNNRVLDFGIWFANLRQLVADGHPLPANIDCMVYLMARIFDLDEESVREFFRRALRLRNDVVVPTLMVSLGYMSIYYPELDMDTLRKLESEAIPNADQRMLDKIEKSWTITTLRQVEFDDGRREGRQEEREVIAIRMLESEVDIEQICYATNLSREEVEKLRNGRSD